MKQLSRGLVVALALAAVTTPALAQDRPVELRFSHWVPPSHPMHTAAVAWAASIEKASNGSIRIAIFPSQQLGRAFDHYNLARDGIVDIAHVNPATSRTASPSSARWSSPSSSPMPARVAPQWTPGTAATPSVR